MLIQFSLLRESEAKKISRIAIVQEFSNSHSSSRHLQKSDLHRQNLESWRRDNASDALAASLEEGAAASGFAYRDRAKERRKKFGKTADDDPRPNRLKEKYLQAMEAAADNAEAGSRGGAAASGGASKAKEIDESNIGNRMLQKMGWKEGLGLGKSNQGRTSLIEVRLVLFCFELDIVLSPFFCSGLVAIAHEYFVIFVIFVTFFICSLQYHR